MTWPANVERWRQYVSWECKDLPVDLVLSVINHESRGIPGAISNGKTQAHAIPKGDSTTITVNHALGLTQCTAATIDWYNKAGRGTGEPTTYQEMIGTGERDTRQQIRVGCALLALQVAQLYQFDPVTFSSRSASGATPDQLRFALIAYAIGGGWTQTSADGPGLKPRLIALQNAGLPLTFDQLAANNPLWGKSENPDRGWLNRPIQMARSTFAHYQANAQGPPGGAPGAAPGASKPGTLATVGSGSNWQTMTPVEEGGPAAKLGKLLKDNWMILLLVAAVYLSSRNQGGGFLGLGGPPQDAEDQPEGVG